VVAINTWVATQTLTIVWAYWQHERQTQGRISMQICSSNTRDTFTFYCVLAASC
jgi:hypothetical protein